MAVNNFAPAEYGGYVLPANSGGGGGGTSPFDEWLGVTGYAEVTINYTFPEGSEDTGLNGGESNIKIGTFDEDDIFSTSHGYEFRIMNPELFVSSGSFAISVPLFDDKATTLETNMYLDAVNGSYIVTSAELSGNITQNGNYYVITGDGVINATLGLA